ncbi:MAG: GTPase [Clostridia bacterium]|nr:GTPase [Clostridia bacterium]
MPEIPVYLFTGFLEAGKTKFIQETLQDPRFNSGEHTLLLLCEEGVEEYEPAKFSGKHVNIAVIEEESDLTEDHLADLIRKYPADRVVVEYNGMWKLDTLYQNMPESWTVYQEIMLADAGTFLGYNANMRQLVVDKLKTCELVAFNRFDPLMDKMEFHKIVRGISRRAEIAYETVDGVVSYDDIEDPLPFDLEAPIIEIGDDAFALWYRDIAEELDKYRGKVVRVKGRAAVDKRLPKGCFIFGRHLMTCCVDDIEFVGFACTWDGKNPPLQAGDWIMLEARIDIRNHPAYGKPGPVLEPVSITSAQAPLQDVATFY